MRNQILNNVEDLDAFETELSKVTEDNEYHDEQEFKLVPNSKRVSLKFPLYVVYSVHNNLQRSWINTATYNIGELEEITDVLYRIKKKQE